MYIEDQEIEIANKAISDLTNFGFKLNGTQYTLEEVKIDGEQICAHCAFSAFRRRIEGVMSEYICNTVESTMCDTIHDEETTEVIGQLVFVKKRENKMLDFKNDPIRIGDKVAVVHQSFSSGPITLRIKEIVGFTKHFVKVADVGGASGNIRISADKICKL